MPRTVKEWIGKTDDSQPTAAVKQRVFDRANGICHWCKLPIKVPGETWQADHVIAIINGGPNRETNLAPIHGHCHVAKTGLDRKDKDKVAAIRQKHTGSRRPSSPLAKKGKPERTSRHAKLEPKRLFVEADR